MTSGESSTSRRTGRRMPRKISSCHGSPTSRPPRAAARSAPTAADASGNGLRGESIDFLTSAGRFGLVQDLGNGDYRITLNVPADATGSVKISALSADGPSALAQVIIRMRSPLIMNLRFSMK
jgi:hypothetical protein